MPPAPKLGGFYQRDSRDLEAQLLAQAFAARTGQQASDQPKSSDPVPGAALLQGSRAQSPAVLPGAAQHSAAGTGLDAQAAQAPAQPGLWAVGRPAPSMPASSAPLPGGLRQTLDGMPGSGLGQLAQPGLWQQQQTDLGMLGGQQQQNYSMFSGALGLGLPANMSMPGLSMAGQDAQGYAGNWGFYGAVNGGAQSPHGFSLPGVQYSRYLLGSLLMAQHRVDCFHGQKPKDPK